MWRISPALPLVGLLASGCATQPLGSDGIEPAAGLAPSLNLEVHAADVTSNTVRRPNPGGDGKAVYRSFEQYRERPVIADTNGTTDPD